MNEQGQTNTPWQRRLLPVFLWVGLAVLVTVLYPVSLAILVVLGVRVLFRYTDLGAHLLHAATFIIWRGVIPSLRLVKRVGQVCFQYCAPWIPSAVRAQGTRLYAFLGSVCGGALRRAYYSRPQVDESIILGRRIYTVSRALWGELYRERPKDARSLLAFTFVDSSAYHLGWLLTGAMLYSLFVHRMEQAEPGTVVSGGQTLINGIPLITVIAFAAAFSFFFFRAQARAAKKRFAERAKRYFKHELATLPIEVVVHFGARAFNGTTEAGRMLQRLGRAFRDAPYFVGDVVWGTGSLTSMILVISVLGLLETPSALIMLIMIVVRIACSTMFLVEQLKAQRVLYGREKELIQWREAFSHPESHLAMWAAGSERYLLDYVGEQSESAEEAWRESDEAEYAHEEPQVMWFWIAIVVGLYRPLYLTLEGEMSVRVFLLFLFSETSLQWSVDYLNLSVAKIIRALPDMELMFTFMEKARAATAGGGTAPDHEAQRAVPVNSQITFRDVGFKHPRGAEVFRGLTFEIPSQYDVAVVGYRGSGKTTLLNLLTGYWRPTTGRIFLGGQEYCDVELLRWVDYTTQTAFPRVGTPRRAFYAQVLQSTEQAAPPEKAIVSVLEEFDLWEALCKQAEPLINSPYLEANSNPLDLFFEQVSLSPGQAQDFHLALRYFGLTYRVRVLGQPPPRIIAIDELQQNLDRPTARRRFKAFKALANEWGARMFHVTHDDGIILPDTFVVSVSPPQFGRRLRQRWETSQVHADFHQRRLEHEAYREFWKTISEECLTVT